MTTARDIAEQAFDRVADGVARHGWQELDPVRVATDGRRTGDALGLGVERRLAKRVLRGPIRREMDWLRDAWTGQYHVLLDGIADDGDGDREGFVEADPFLEHYVGPDRAAFVDAVRTHHDRLVDGLTPILSADLAAVGATDDPPFWTVAADVYDEPAARELLDDMTRHGDILAGHRDDVSMTLAIDVPVFSEQSVDYGAEAVRVIREGIDAMRSEEERRLARAFD